MKSPHAKLSRRNFLLGVAAGTAATAAAVVGGGGKSSDPAQQRNAGGKKGYQLTEHVRNYYRTARI